jgi:uncharacterized membrane protein YphA (DoxX/SURF4 family)
MSTYAASAHATTSHPTRRRVGRVALWVLQVALAVVFVAAGGAKLAGAPAMVQLFDAVGVGQWLRHVTGLLEIAGAVLLLVPALAGLGALLLAVVMVGAVAAHLLVLHTPPAPLPLLVALVIIAAVRRAEIAAVVARLGGRSARSTP